MTTIRKNKDEIMLRRQNSCFSCWLKFFNQRLMINTANSDTFNAYLRHIHIYEKTVTDHFSQINSPTNNFAKLV